MDVGLPVSGFDFLYDNPVGDEFTLSFSYSPPDDYQTAYQAYNQPSLGTLRVRVVITNHYLYFGVKIIHSLDCSISFLLR